MSSASPPDSPHCSGRNIVIPFPAMPYVSITSRMIEETTRVTCNGTARVRYDPPSLAYFIDYHDEDGFSCCVWDGRTYDGALAAARTWAEEGVAVRDHTRETRGHG